MKKITLTFFMFTMTLFCFSQTELVTNGDFETPDTGWILFQNGGSAAYDNTISNGGTTSGRLETGGPSNPAFKQENIGVGAVDSGDVTITFDHIGTIVPPGGVFNVLLFGEGAAGASFTHVFNPTPALSGSWQTFTGTFTIPPGTDLTNGLSFLIEAVCGGDAGCSVVANIDNVSLVAQDAAPPTCTDGIQNGQETGIDCGGPDCAPCAGDPTVDSPELDSTGDNLIVYGVVADNNSVVSNFNFNAFSGSVTVSETDIEGNGNNAGLLVGAPGAFWFYGAEWTAEDLVAGGYNFVHLNYYTPASTEFNFFLIDQSAGIPGGAAEEPRYRFGGSNPDEAIVTGSWQSVFIPLTHFTSFPTGGFSFDLNDIFQYKFDGNGTVYFDNIYFSTTDTLGVNDLDATSFSTFPNPTLDVWNIKSNNINIQSVQLFNTLGRLVKTIEVDNIEVSIDASELSSGIYFAKVNSQGNSAQTIKLIKK